MKIKLIEDNASPIKKFVFYGSLFLFVLFTVALVFSPSTNQSLAQPGTTLPSAVTAEAEPQIELTDFRLLSSGDSSFIHAGGKLRNIGNSRLDKVRVSVSFLSRTGELIRVDSELVKYNPILPSGETSFE